MKAFKDYNDVKEFTESVKLPAGAYEVTFKRAEDTDKAICLLFDISAGDFAGYFMEKFASDKKNYPDNAKYKGVMRLWYPGGNDTAESAEIKKRRNKTALELIKRENKLSVDYSKEWDGAVMKGAKIGMIFQDKEYDYNGHHGYTAQPYGLISLEALRDGKYTIPEPKRLKASSASADCDDSFMDMTNADDDDLPF